MQSAEQKITTSFFPRERLKTHAKNFTATGKPALIDVRVYPVLYIRVQNWHRVHFTA